MKYITWIILFILLSISVSACPDTNGDNIVAFIDYIGFAENFNKDVDEDNQIFDLDNNNIINFNDFIGFAQLFGKECAAAPSATGIIEQVLEDEPCLDLNFDYMINDSDLELLDKCKERDNEYLQLCEAAGLLEVDIDAWFNLKNDQSTLCSLELVGELDLRGSFRFMDNIQSDYCPYPNCYSSEQKKCIDVGNSYTTNQNSMVATCINGLPYYSFIEEQRCTIELYCDKEDIQIRDVIAEIHRGNLVQTIVREQRNVIEGSGGICDPHRNHLGLAIENTGIVIPGDPQPVEISPGVTFIPDAMSDEQWQTIYQLAQDIPNPFSTTSDNNVELIIDLSSSNKADYVGKCFGVWTPPEFLCNGEPTIVNTCSQSNPDIIGKWKIGPKYVPPRNIFRDDLGQEGFIKVPTYGSSDLTDLSNMFLGSGPGGLTRRLPPSPIIGNVILGDPLQSQTGVIDTGDSGSTDADDIEDTYFKIQNFFSKETRPRINTYPSRKDGKVIGVVEVTANINNDPPDNVQIQVTDINGDFYDINDAVIQVLSSDSQNIITIPSASQRSTVDLKYEFSDRAICYDAEQKTVIEGCLANDIQYKARARILDHQGRPLTTWSETSLVSYHIDKIPPFIETLRQVEQDVYSCNDFRWTNPDIDPIIIEEENLGLSNDIKWRFKDTQVNSPFFYQIQYTNDMQFWFDLPGGDLIDSENDDFKITEKVFRPHDWEDGQSPTDSEDLYRFANLGDVKYHRDKVPLEKTRIMHLGYEECVLNGNTYNNCLPEGIYVYRVRAVNDDGFPLSYWGFSDYMYINYSHINSPYLDNDQIKVVDEIISSRMLTVSYSDADKSMSDSWTEEELDKLSVTKQFLAYDLARRYNIFDDEQANIAEGCSGWERSVKIGIAVAVIVADHFFTGGMINNMDGGFLKTFLFVSNTVATGISGGILGGNVGRLVCGNSQSCVQSFATFGSLLGAGASTEDFFPKLIQNEATQRTGNLMRKVCPLKSGIGGQLCGLTSDFVLMETGSMITGANPTRRKFLSRAQLTLKNYVIQSTGQAACSSVSISSNSLYGRHLCKVIGEIAYDNSVNGLKDFRNINFKQDIKKIGHALQRADPRKAAAAIKLVRYVNHPGDWGDAVVGAFSTAGGHTKDAFQASFSMVRDMPGLVNNRIGDLRDKISSEELQEKIGLWEQIEDCTVAGFDLMLSNLNKYSIPVSASSQLPPEFNQQMHKESQSYLATYGDDARDSEIFKAYEELETMSADSQLSANEIATLAGYSSERNDCLNIMQQKRKAENAIKKVLNVEMEVYIRLHIEPIIQDILEAQGTPEDEVTKTLQDIKQYSVTPIIESHDISDNVGSAFSMFTSVDSFISSYNPEDEIHNVFFAISLLHQNSHYQDHLECSLSTIAGISRYDTELNAYKETWNAIQSVPTSYPSFIALRDEEEVKGDTCLQETGRDLLNLKECATVFVLGKTASQDESKFFDLMDNDPVYGKPTLFDSMSCANNPTGFALSEEVPRLMGEAPPSASEEDIFDLIADKASCGPDEGLQAISASVIAITGYSTHNPLTCIAASENNVELIVRKILFEMRDRIEITENNFNKVIVALAKKNPDWLQYESELIAEFNVQAESVPETSGLVAVSEGDRILINAITPEILVAEPPEAAQLIANDFWEESEIKSSLLDNRLKWSIDTISSITDDLGFNMDIILAEQYLQRFGSRFDQDIDLTKPIFSVYFASRTDNTFFKDLVTRNHRDFQPGITNLYCYAESGVPFRLEGSDPVDVTFNILVDGEERNSVTYPDCFTVGNDQLYDEYSCQGPSLESILQSEDLIKDITCQATINYNEDEQTVERKLDLSDYDLTGPSLEIIIDNMLMNGNLEQRLRAVDLITPGINMLLDEHMNKLLSYLEDPDLVIPLTYALRQSDVAEQELGEIAIDRSKTLELRLRAIETLGNIAPKTSYLQSITDIEEGTIYASEAQHAQQKDEDFALVLNDPGPAITPILVTSEYYLQEIASGAEVQAIVYESESPGLVKGIIQFGDYAVNLILKRTENMNYYFIDIPGADNTFYFIPTLRDEKPFRFIDGRNTQRHNTYREDGIYSFQSAHKWTDDVIRGQLNFNLNNFAAFKESFNRGHNFELLAYIKDKAGIIPETYNSVAKWLSGLFPESKHDLGSFGSRIGTSGTG